MRSVAMSNPDASVRGYIHYLNKNRVEVRSINGQTLGWYNPTSNITYNVNGNMIGFGNFLTNLI